MCRTLLALAAFTVLALPAVESAPTTTIVIDGSSTVYPITVAIGERYAAQNPNIGIEVLCSGTTAGFRRLVTGEVPISGASRPIKADELAKATKAGIEIVELPVAFDGLSVVVNKHNTFVQHLTVAELKKMWEPDSTVTSWRQVRASFPDVPLALFGPGKDSGTFDFFTEVIVGTSRAARSDFTASEDDNDLVQGVVRNPGGLGYFGMSYFHENEALLRAVPIDAGKGPVAATPETVANGTYRPLSRPLFLYVNKAALARNDVRQFLEAYLKMVPSIAPQIGYVPFAARTYELVSARFTARTAGTMFAQAPEGARLDELLMAQAVVRERAKEPAPTAQAKSPATSSPRPPTAGAVVAAAVPAPAPAAPAAPVAVPQRTASASTPTRTTLGSLDAQRVGLVRERALSLARVSLDESAATDELAARIEELRLLTAGLAAPATAAAPTIPDDAAGFATLIARLQLTSVGRTVLDEAALARLKAMLTGIADATLRREVATTLLQPGPELLPRFTAAISAANGGKADVDVVLCYARNGFSLP